MIYTLPGTSGAKHQYKAKYDNFIGGKWVAPVRGEYRFEVGPVSCAVYLEVLNVTNTMNVYSWVYGAGDVTGGVPPTQGRFNHLPIRPFLGIRGEY